MYMKEKTILTAESVTEGHPDKLCDIIADSVLDECLKNDPNARVACEVMATAGKVIVAGEITAKELPDIPYIVCKTIKHIGYDCDYEVEVITHDQSGDIAGAVDKRIGDMYIDDKTGRITEDCSGTDDYGSLGAGDQGIMYGYATNETPQFLPLPVVLAHRLTLLLASVRRGGKIKGLLPDGKAQVSVEYVNGYPKRVTSVIVSAQHEANMDMKALKAEIVESVVVPALGGIPYNEKDVLVNPSGRFVQGGFDADTGLTGRKLMVDTYGGLAPHGGGALSGKDATKVDRSGAYMARYIAKNIVAAGIADECTVSLAYAIGKTEPVAVDVDTHEIGEYDDDIIEEAVKSVFDLTPSGIIRTLGLTKPIYEQTACYGHFTRASLPWERINRTNELRILCESIEEERMG
jgi:S-adenosylmethionine synthetase